MTLVNAEVYRAFKAAGVDDACATAAAKAVLPENLNKGTISLKKIKSDIAVMKYMLWAVITIQTLLLLADLPT